VPARSVGGSLGSASRGGCAQGWQKRACQVRSRRRHSSGDRFPLRLRPPPWQSFPRVVGVLGNVFEVAVALDRGSSVGSAGSAGSGWKIHVRAAFQKAGERRRTTS